MWSSYPSHISHSVSCSPCRSPVPFSSNMESDSDWMNDLLEQARLNRSTFYRRLQSVSKNLEADDTALYKSRKSPVKTEVDEATLVVPHTSWRFYTSYDNGEWKRHAVPVESKEEMNVNASKCIGRSDTQKSACQAAESSRCRTRHKRTSAAELYQKRLEMRTRDISDGDVTVQRNISNSSETGSTAPQGVPEARKTSSRRRTLSFMDRSRRSLSPTHRLNTLRDVSSSGELVTSFVRSDSNFRSSQLMGSVVIDGVEDKTKERVIVPTKYKQIENKTAAADRPPDTGVLIHGGSVAGHDDVRGEVQNGSVSCMTGEGDVHGDVLLEDQENKTTQNQSHLMKHVTVKNGEEKAGGGGGSVVNGDAVQNLIRYGFEHIQCNTASEFIETNAINSIFIGAENPGIQRVLAPTINHSKITNGYDDGKHEEIQHKINREDITVVDRVGLPINPVQAEKLQSSCEGEQHLAGENHENKSNKSSTYFSMESTQADVLGKPTVKIEKQELSGQNENVDKSVNVFSAVVNSAPTFDVWKMAGNDVDSAGTKDIDTVEADDNDDWVVEMALRL